MALFAGVAVVVVPEGGGLVAGEMDLNGKDGESVIACGS